MSHVLEVGVAHVVDGQHEAVLVLRQALPYGLEQALLVLARLLRHRRGVDHPGSFRLGHLVSVCVSFLFFFPFLAFFGLARVRLDVGRIRWLYSRDLLPFSVLVALEE